MTSAPRDTESLRDQLAAMLPELRDRYGVRSVAIFGSYARSEQEEGSDIDLLVDFDDAPDLFRMGELVLDIEEALGIRVDFFTPRTLKSRIAPRVFQELLPVE